MSCRCKIRQPKRKSLLHKTSPPSLNNQYETLYFKTTNELAAFRRGLINISITSEQ
jgi:hypothetical protein